MAPSEAQEATALREDGPKQIFAVLLSPSTLRYYVCPFNLTTNLSSSLGLLSLLLISSRLFQMQVSLYLEVPFFRSYSSRGFSGLPIASPDNTIRRTRWIPREIPKTSAPTSVDFSGRTQNRRLRLRSKGSERERLFSRLIRNPSFHCRPVATVSPIPASSVLPTAPRRVDGFSNLFLARPEPA